MCVTLIVPVYTARAINTNRPQTHYSFTYYAWVHLKFGPTRAIWHEILGADKSVCSLCGGIFDPTRANLLRKFGGRRLWVHLLWWNIAFAVNSP